MHLLISRRSKQFFNSTGHDLEPLRERGTTNYAYMHPDDIAQRGLADGAIIEIAATHACIHGVVRATFDVKPGVISMSHAFGEADGGLHDVATHGASTNRLVDDERGFDPITGQCRQSAIAVRVARAPHSAAT
jgi:anaerobic selenocysteine-containing dehydrogenase